MIPYFDTKTKPTPEMMHLKMQEGLLALLQTDERFYPCLFDFTAPWKIDIEDFMNKNYMYNLSLAELARFTGRSLAAFKRDFQQFSPLSRSLAHAETARSSLRPAGIQQAVGNGSGI